MGKIISLTNPTVKQLSNGALFTHHLEGSTLNNSLLHQRTQLLKNYELLTNQKIGMCDFLNIFSNNDDCLELYFSLKFSTCDCVKCGRSVISNYTRIGRKNENGVPKKAFRCRSCHTYIYPLSDSAFSGSTIPLKDIFFLIYILCGRGTSALEIASTIGISYKTAHKIMMQIRQSLYSTNKSKMEGDIEVDEAFIGKGSKAYNWSGISTHKQPIIGLIDRKTKQARLFLVPNRSAITIHKLIRNNVADGSTIYTDSWRGYTHLSKFYNHEVVDHSKREFVRGDAHTNNIESLWGQFKRNLRRSHIKISDKYVQFYLNEACWRHNSKGIPQMKLFSEILIRTFFWLD